MAPISYVFIYTCRRRLKGKCAIALPRKVKSLSELDFNLFFPFEVVSSVAFLMILCA